MRVFSCTGFKCLSYVVCKLYFFKAILYFFYLSVWWNNTWFMLPTNSTWCQKWQFFYQQISQVRHHSLDQKFNIFVNQLISELCNLNRDFECQRHTKAQGKPLFSKVSVSNLTSVRVMWKREQQVNCFWTTST